MPTLILESAILTTLLIADMNQTRRTLTCPLGCYEQNPLIGHNPSPIKIRNYFGSMIIGSQILTWTLPPSEAHKFLVGAIMVEAVMVGRNQYLGFKATF